MDAIGISAGAQASIYFEDTSAVADEKRFTIKSLNGAFGIQTDTDAGAFGANIWLVQRTGVTIDTLGTDAVRVDLAGGTLRIIDSSGADFADFSHDSVDFILDLANIGAGVFHITGDGKSVELGGTSDTVNLALLGTSQLSLPLSTTGGATFNIAIGAAPTSPADGDIWHDTTLNALVLRSGGGNVNLAAGADITANEIITGEWIFQSNPLTIDSDGGEALIFQGNGAGEHAYITWQDDAAAIDFARIGIESSAHDLILRSVIDSIILDADGAIGSSITLMAGSTGNIDLQGQVQFAAAGTTKPSFNIPEGSAPSSPVDGDVWLTTTDIIARVNGVSKSLIAETSNFADNIALTFGDADDVSIVWDSVDWEITGLAAGQVWNFRDGPIIRIFEDADVDYLEINVDGIDAQIDLFQCAHLSIGESATGFTGVKLSGKFYMLEDSAAAADIAAYGQFWVRNDTPNIPMFTDDAGGDLPIDPSYSEIDIHNTNYTLVLANRGETIHKAAGGAGVTITIPVNSSVAFKIGTLIGFQNDGGSDLSIAITTDTLTGTDGATGTRTLGDNHTAVIQKMTATTWKYAASDL